MKTLNYLLYTPLAKKRTLEIARKYPLCGYILGVLTHTTAWDRLGRVRILSSLGLKLHIHSSGSMTMMKLGSLMGCRLQNAGYLCLAQHFSGIGVTLNVFSSPLKYIWKLCSVKVSVSVTFFDTGRDRTGRTHTRTDGHMDRQTFLGKYYFRW